mmetsp:Transcript_20965/g.29379  ORF Transcript_20965/g.29379 Transcript_20965/m.29379 type:complete len:234 (+) Transcript_20965:474-1175(+)
MMTRIGVEGDPRLIFQYAVLILHSQMSSGMLHTPSKLIPQITSILETKLTPDGKRAIQRARELLADEAVVAALASSRNEKKGAKAGAKKGGAAGAGGGDDDQGEDYDGLGEEGKLKKLRSTAKRNGISSDTISKLLEEGMDDEDMAEVTVEDLIDDMGIPEAQAKLVVAAVSGEEEDTAVEDIDDSREDAGAIAQEQQDEEEKETREKIAELHKCAGELKKMGSEPRKALLQV